MLLANCDRRDELSRRDQDLELRLDALEHRFDQLLLPRQQPAGGGGEQQDAKKKGLVEELLGELSEIRDDAAIGQNQKKDA